MAIMTLKYSLRICAKLIHLIPGPANFLATISFANIKIVFLFLF